MTDGTHDFRPATAGRLRASFLMTAQARAAVEPAIGAGPQDRIAEEWK
jgi:hypothetical protein